MPNWIQSVQSYFHAFLHLFYPHICLQCGTDALAQHQALCSNCEAQLPFTHFGNMQNNPIEKIFWGRVPVDYAYANLFFTKESIVQKLIIELKYHQNKKAGYLLGSLIALELKTNPKFQPIDYLIPIPIRKRKLRKRGFNQSLVICEGILSSGIQAGIFTGLLKTKNTLTQTRKDRLQRSAQANTLFYLTNFNQLNNKHLLIVDDVITTGATLEAACLSLRIAQPASVKVVTAAYTLR
jgi:ComF family protein